jgi:hypothetical protein
MASMGWPPWALACAPQKNRRTSACDGLNIGQA